MKKANLVNLLIIAIIFILFYIVNLFITQNNIDIYYHFNYSYGFKISILIIFYLLFMVGSVLYASRQVFNLYIRHIRKTKLIYSRYALILTSLIVSYVFLYFAVDYYYYFGSILILYMIYFMSLFLYDNYYIKKSQEAKIVVNNQVVENFLNLLGGKENILSVSYEYSRLKVELKDIKAVDLESMKNSGAKGAFIAGNKLQAVIGSNAEDLENAIKAYLTQV
ncbi:PTS transporter subunit EIIB [Mycoplasmatota bacterium]|nr:PTS transporter subunit EIIB [Mycoplasmatota bacterium]